MSEPMRIVFMGTSDFAAQVLDKLVNEHTIITVFTRPDAVSGRGKSLSPSPVRACADRHALTVHTPHDFYLRDEEGIPMLGTAGTRVVDATHIAALEQGQPDIIVVASYGVILPEAIINATPLRAVNVHASLLPRWRGAAPIQRAILAGDEQTGVSIMRMTPRLDDGPFCAQAATAIADKDTGTLTDELAQMGAALLIKHLAPIASGCAQWTEQDDTLVTYADKITKQELHLVPTDSAEKNLRRIRASSPQAPARCIIAGRSVAITAAQAVSVAEFSPESPFPGTVILRNKCLYLVCSLGSLEIQRLKPDGKQQMEARAFANGLAQPPEQQIRWETC